VVALEREQDEKREAEQSVAAYKRQLASLGERVASIDVEIEQYRAITANLRRGASPFL
jgi:kinetochore protein Spc25, fungi type